MNNSDNSDEENIPKSPFAVYRTEADALFRSAKYTKAIKSYSQALELQPDHEHCLVARSRCYLFEGHIDKALADAESSLANNSKNPKGLFQKAEVYYFQSEFEKALVLYHRGHKLRPEMEAFRLGIQKSEEAINNSVGNPETIKLRLDCDLSYFFLNDEKKNERVIKKKTQEKKKVLERKPCNTDSRTVKQLLGELYSDREFLEKLLNEEEALVNKTENSEQIRHLVVKGLNYLDERSDFWQQQKPMYARKKFHLKSSKSSSAFVTKQQRDIIKYVVSTLDEIDSKQIKGDHKRAIKQSQYLITQIDKWSENDLPDRLDIIANLYCLIGNSYLDMEDYENALLYHEKDKECWRKYKIEESLSRSIDNIGRVYAKQKNYNKAIEIWQEKIPMSKSALESTWLHHEMGRCYLELGDYEKAIDYGERSIEFAREAEDDTWQMNASILVAHASTKYRKYNLAIDYFQRALEYSRIMKNLNVEEAVKKAIEDVNQKMIAEESEFSSKENETDTTEKSKETTKTESRIETETTVKSKDTSKIESKTETDNTYKSSETSKTENRNETVNTGKSIETHKVESRSETENTGRSLETTRTETRDETDNQKSSNSTERNVNKNEVKKDESSHSEVTQAKVVSETETSEKIEITEKQETVVRKEHVTETETIEKSEVIVEKQSFEKKEKEEEQVTIEKESIVVEKEVVVERNVVIEKEMESERADDIPRSSETHTKGSNGKGNLGSPKEDNNVDKSDKTKANDLEDNETTRNEVHLEKNEHTPTTPLEEIQLE